MANSSSAYDFSLFEAHSAAVPAPKTPAAPAKKKKSNVIRLNEKQLRRSHRRNAHAFRTILSLGVVLVVVGAIGAIVFSQVQLTGLTEQINTTTTALAEQESIAVQLEMQAAEKMNTDEVEAYAREMLGMEKATEGQTTYISLAQDAAGTVAQENTAPNIFVQIWESTLSIFS